MSPAQPREEAGVVRLACFSLSSSALPSPIIEFHIRKRTHGTCFSATPSGGHAVHLTSSSREQHNGGGPGKSVGGGGPGGKIQQQLSKHQPQLINSSNEPLHQQLAGGVHASAHLHTHPDLDPRVMSGGGGGGHHGPPPPPPPKVEAIGMIDAWTRMPPQYASQPTSLEPQFISSSPAAYYHAPVRSPAFGGTPLT